MLLLLGVDVEAFHSSVKIPVKYFEQRASCHVITFLGKKPFPQAAASKTRARQQWTSGANRICSGGKRLVRGRKESATAKTRPKANVENWTRPS
jgi:hypothetical protein